MNPSSGAVVWRGLPGLLLIARRWGPTIGLAAVVAGGAALAVSAVLPREYKATAQLYVAPAANPTAALQDVLLGQNLAKTYTQLVTSDVVLRRAQEAAAWPDLKSFRERTQVALVRDTSIITVAFREQDPNRAADIANLIANSFVEQTRVLQSSLQSTTLIELDKVVQSIESDIQRVDTDLMRLRATLSALPAFPQAAPAEIRAQISQLESTRGTRQQALDQLQRTRDDLRLVAARAENTVTVWESAVAPIEPESPRVLLNILVGAIAGALVAVAGIVISRYLADRATDAGPVRERLGVSAL